nr:hypothetical protein [Tanacetum cinerariifolium]
MIVHMDEDVEVNLEEAQAKAYNLDLQHSKKALSMQDIDEEEPAEVEKVLEVIKAAKLFTEVVTTTEPTTTTAAQVPKSSAPRRRRGVGIQDPKETTTLVIMYTKDKAFARQLEAELNVNINWNDVIEQKEEEEVTVQDKEIKDEGNKRQGESLEQEIVKKQRMDEEAEELKIHLQIVANDDDDVEDLETLWKLVKERFKTTELKNFSDDFLLNILKIMFEKPHIEGNMFLLVEMKYPLTYFTLEKMLNNVRLEVEEESEMSLELLRLVPSCVVIFDLLPFVIVFRISDADVPSQQELDLLFGPLYDKIFNAADADVPSQQELDLLFGPLYDKFFNAGSNPSTNIQSTSAPLTHTNVHAEENNNDQAEEGEQL